MSKKSWYICKQILDEKEGFIGQFLWAVEADYQEYALEKLKTVIEYENNVDKKNISIGNLSVVCVFNGNIEIERSTPRIVAGVFWLGGFQFSLSQDSTGEK